MKLYKIITYGCQMNVHESEKLAGALVDCGYDECDDVNDADVVVFNTCCIRETAEHKAYGNIGALKKLKSLRPDMIIAVCGCMPQQDGVSKTLSEKFPFVDIIFGTHNLHEFKQLLLRKLQNGKKIIEVWDKEKNLEKSNATFIRSDRANAWVNIMYGCNNFCTYCIVPYVRGRERSRDAEEVLQEINQLIADGYTEITLLGQNVNSYGNDLENGIKFYELMEKAAQLSGNYRLKFMTSHPKDFDDKLIEVIAKYPNISKSIHLPVQAGSNNVLKAMNRHYTVEDYIEKINKLKKLVPDCGITTDIMVGFPGETDSDFEETLKLVKEVEYSAIYSFVFSPRKNTPAATMDNQITAEIKKKRITSLIAEQSKIVSKNNRSKYLGNVFEVLVEGISDKADIYCGKTNCGRTIKFKSNENIIGQFVKVKVVKAAISALGGELI